MVSKHLKIAIIAPPWLPVPPERYGGVEWVVSLLADRLAELGHDVTLYACGGSITQAQLVTTSEDGRIAQFGQLVPELEHALLSFRDASRFDIISDHSGLAAAAMADLASAPVVHTVHSPLNDEPGRIYRLIAELNPRLRFISTSLKQREPAEDLPWIANCPSALDLDAYPYSDRRGEYLLFIGRMSPQKGAGARDRRRAGDGPAAQARRQDARGRRARVLRPRGRAASVGPHRVPRRGVARGEGAAAAARPLHAVPDRLGGAVRARHAGVDGVRHAGRRHPPRRRARGDLTGRVGR